METTNQNTLWYIVGAVVLIAVGALWYFNSMQTPLASMPSSNNNSAAAISAEFNQIPDDSAALTQDQAASAQAVSSF